MKREPNDPSQAAQTALACADGNGNIGAWIDLGAATANDQLVGRQDYDPFGRVVSSTLPAGFSPIGFSSKVTDAETGLVYYTHRYLSTELGRWVNRDPIEERGGRHLYGMVGNDAVNEVDVLGMGPCEDKFKGTLRHIVNKIGRFRDNVLAHKKEVAKRTRDLVEDPGKLKHNGKTTPPYPPSETRNGHFPILDFHLAKMAEAEALAAAAVEEYNEKMAEYLACRAALKSGVALKCCKQAVKKIGTIVFILWDCSSDGAEAAANNALWPLSELWEFGPETMPTIEGESNPHVPFPELTPMY
jgi:RHS repeat-associated protein